MTQSYRGLCFGKASQLSSNDKGVYLMSNHYWVTPEEVARVKKRNKTIMYASFPVATFILTALLTLLLN